MGTIFFCEVHISEKTTCIQYFKMKKVPYFKTPPVKVNEQSLHFIEVKNIQLIIKATYTERQNYLLGSVPTLKITLSKSTLPTKIVCPKKWKTVLMKASMYEDYTALLFLDSNCNTSLDL